MALSKQPFGTVGNQEVHLYTINFPGRLKASVMNYGGILTSLYLPDCEGKMADVVLGFDKPEDYRQNEPYFGAMIGRYANRIAGGRFSLNGKVYSLAINNGGNHLHGGIKGFDKVVWQVKDITDTPEKVELIFSHLSRDGEEGYPGNLSVEVTYTFTPNSWQIEYRATTDKPTIINLTQHSYFNLSGNPQSDILDHELQVNAGSFLPVDKNLLPTGERLPVAGTPFDFKAPAKIGDKITSDHQQLHLGNGFDHSWISEGQGKRLVAGLYHPESGRKLQVLTTEPGIQVYTGNFLAGQTGKGGVQYKKHAGICLETQHFPDSPNQPDFPSVILVPGERFYSSTTYKFSVK